MHLYPFSSDDEENVQRAFDAGVWAVRPWSSGPLEKARRTRASRMPIGAAGILYCKSTRSFLMPFIVRSRPDPDAKIDNLWSGEWVLPFSFWTLGDARHRISLDDAKRAWGFLHGCQNVSQQLPLSGAATFAGKRICVADWSSILVSLAD